jgi:hypothetical protein
MFAQPLANGHPSGTLAKEWEWQDNGAAASTNDAIRAPSLLRRPMERP